MSGGLGVGLPAPGTVKASLVLVGVILVVGAGVTAVGGTSAGLVVGLASGSAMTFGTVMPTRVAVVVTVALGAAAALGAAVSGQALLSGLAVGITALATAPATAYSAGMFMLAPLITLVFAVTDRGFTWWQAGLWGMVGGLVGLAVAGFLKYGKQPPKPLPWPIAWRHAVVLALAAGVSVAGAEVTGEPHAYWVTVTLLVALRPIPDERSAYALPRIAGTLLGALLAVVLVLLLPANLLMLAAIGCLLALAAYAMSANYFMQTVFLTPMLLLFMTSGDPAEATIELTVGRVLYTLIGAALVVLLAWGMTGWDQRSAIPADPARAPAPD